MLHTLGTYLFLPRVRCTGPRALCANLPNFPIPTLPRVTGGPADEFYAMSGNDYLASYFGERDPIYADKILKRIGDQWDVETWGRQEDFEKIKQWVSAIAPMAAQVRVIEATAAANEQTPE